VSNQVQAEEAEAVARRVAAAGGSRAAAGHYHISHFRCSRRPGCAAGRAPTPRAPVLTTHMVSAYIALASNTYNKTFHSLDEIRKYVVKKEKKDNDK